MKRAEIQKPGQRLFGLSAPLRAAVIPPLSAARWLLVLIVAAGVYFFHGFLFPVLAALVIAFASWPLYRRLLAGVGGNRTIAATLAILFILTFLVVPIALAGTYAINELREWVVWAIET
ncbi:MAG: AI-2E family transporter, partial [Mesorhizobium sp.]